MKAMMSRSLVHCGIVAASILAALILCESLLRVFGVTYPVFDDFDGVRGFGLRPGKQGWYRAEGEAYLSINSLGYRDREHDRAKPAHTIRIAVLGDSFVEARQVPLEDTFWDGLGRALQECHAFNGASIEMLNFGIGGYNTSQEYLTLQEDVLDFSPDIVLLAMFLGNDIEGNSRELQNGAAWRIPAPTHSLVDGQLVLDTTFDHSVWRKLLYGLVHHFRTVELINEGRRKLRALTWQSSDPNEIEIGLSSRLYLPPQSPEWRQAWLVTEALLAKMNDLVRSAGARFIVVTIPSAIEVDPVRDHREQFESRLGVDDLLFPDRKIAEIARKDGFQAYPLTKELQEIAERRQVYMHGFDNTRLGFGHFNAQGHRITADLLATKLCNPANPGQ